MATNDTSYTSSRHTWLRVAWEGNGKPSRWFVRIILLFILYYAISWLWQNSLLTARWAQPGKSFSLAFVAATILAAIWMLITAWHLISALGGKGTIILLVAWYAFAVGMKLLALPPDRPLLPALPEQMANVVKEGVSVVIQSITGTPKAIEDFQFAYKGHRDLIDLPGVDEPTEPLTGRIIEPNYITLIETPTSDIEQDIPIPKSEDIETTPSIPSIPGKINVGVYVVVVNTGGDPLRAHITPGVDTEITARFPEGSRVLVLDGPIAEGDLIWWLVEGDQGKGWCAELFLELEVGNN